MARWRKLAVWAMFFPFKEHKPYQGTVGSLDPNRVQDSTWSFNGPYRDTKMDLMTFKKMRSILGFL